MTRNIAWAFWLVVGALIFWYAIDVFLLTFAAILLAIFLNFLGIWTQRLTRIPYPFALITALIVIFGILALIFWLYSPLIALQFQKLMEQLPDAADNLRKNIAPYLKTDFFTKAEFNKEFGLTNQKILSQLMTVFSFTIGSIVGFVIFLIVGLYLAIDPKRYTQGFLFMIPHEKQKKIWTTVERIGQSLRWWLLGKCISMIVIGILTYLGLWILQVNLAFILGLLAAILTFIPYIGPILAAIPAILIGFAQSPFKGLYVIILYISIHIAEGYLITPVIEQKTVSIPPAVTIMSQVLLVMLVGGLGLALATPLVVVGISLAHQLTKR